MNRIGHGYLPHLQQS